MKSARFFGSNCAAPVREELVASLLEEFEVGLDQAQRDVDVFLAMLIEKRRGDCRMNPGDSSDAACWASSRRTAYERCIP